MRAGPPLEIVSLVLPPLSHTHFWVTYISCAQQNSTHEIRHLSRIILPSYHTHDDQVIFSGHVHTWITHVTRRRTHALCVTPAGSQMRQISIFQRHTSHSGKMRAEQAPMVSEMEHETTRHEHERLIGHRSTFTY